MLHRTPLARSFPLLVLLGCWISLAHSEPAATSGERRQSLTELRALEGRAKQAISANDLPELASLHAEMRTRLLLARTQMERAFIVGAWSGPKHKKRAAVVLGQLEAVQMLNSIGLAFLNGYESPTGKVSPSVGDATNKMFVALSALQSSVDEMDGDKRSKPLSGAR